MAGRGGELWAITAYFNPIRFARRLSNFRIFRERLPVPLAAVEVARDRSRFQLESGDADILIQLSGEDLLWQKERLLNIAVRALPAACDTVAWLDCDVAFAGTDWARRVGAALASWPLVQPFRRFHELSPDTRPDQLDPSAAVGSGESAAYRLATGMMVEQLFAEGLGNRLRRGRTLGLAWAGRRPLLDRHGLYDACILGGGDKAMLCAALGRYEYAASLDLNERQMEHYLQWARPFFDDVRGQIGYADADVYHLWHGELSHRKHRQRHRDFKPFGFDPFVDVALDANGCWSWSSHKPEMHDYLRAYLTSRREDG